MNKIILQIRNSEGYFPEEIKGVKVKELIEMLSEFENDDEVVIEDLTIIHGRKYGTIIL